MWAEGPQPAKRACLPQGLEEGARSAPQLLVIHISRTMMNRILDLSKKEPFCIESHPLLDDNIKNWEIVSRNSNQTFVKKS